MRWIWRVTALIWLNKWISWTMPKFHCGYSNSKPRAGRSILNMFWMNNPQFIMTDLKGMQFSDNESTFQRGWRIISLNISIYAFQLTKHTFRFAWSGWSTSTLIVFSLCKYLFVVIGVSRDDYGCDEGDDYCWNKWTLCIANQNSAKDETHN